MNPNVAMWINVALSALGFLAGAGALLTPVFGQGTSDQIVAIAGLTVGLLAAINTALHAVSSPAPGPAYKLIA